ncbi:MAG: MotA/TolQ/ExbB proton channel family protein [Verrucomicrobiales bacterium]
MKKLICILGLLTSLGQAQTTVAEALTDAKVDLRQALSELEKARAEIAAEKPRISADFQKVEAELAEKRRLVRLARQSKEDREMALRELQRDQALREQDASYLAGLLKDQALKVSTLIRAGEPELAVDPASIAGDADDAVAALRARLGIVSASLDRVEALLGGSRSSGKIVAESGEVLEGEFVSAGPQTWFSGAEKGAVFWERGEDLPRLREANEAAVEALFAGSEAEIGMDVTGGKARLLEDIQSGPIDLVRKGGLWVWPILLLALIAMIFGIFKFLSFLRLREPGEAWVAAIIASLHQGDAQKAQSLASRVNHPVGPVMSRLVEKSGSGSEVIEETLYEQLMGVQQKAGSFLPVLAVTAATAPLLGLLGTVSGMIRTFNLITLFGSGDPKPLAGGISEALITTLFGLVVAIPVLILHAFLSRRSQGIVQTTERLGLSFINALRKS